MIDTSKYEGHNRMYAMRCTDDENDMLLFIEDHFEHSTIMDEWWPELFEKFGEDHRFSPHPHRFYSNMECEHAWEGISEVNLRLMADAPLLLAEVKRLQIYERIVLCIALHQQLPDGLHVDEELMLRAREHLRKNGEWEGEEE